MKSTHHSREHETSPPRNSTRVRLSVALLGCVSLAGCELGSSSKKIALRYGEAMASHGTPSTVYESERGLPRCDESQQRRLVYLISEKQFRYCLRGQWDVALGDDWNGTSMAAKAVSSQSGPQGPEGPIGPQGPAGERGSQGKDGLPGAASIVRSTSEAAGLRCPAGGQKFESGSDDGRGKGVANNGLLEADEVTNTAFVCNPISVGLKVYKSDNTPLGHLISYITFPYSGASQLPNALSSGLYVRSLGEDKYAIYQVANSVGLPGGDSVSESNQQLGLLTGNNSVCAVPLFLTNNCTGQAYLNPCASQQSTAINSTLIHFSFNPKFYYRFENTGFDYVFTSNLNENISALSSLSVTGTCRPTNVDTQARRIRIESNVFSDFINPPGTLQTSWFIAP